MAILFNINIDNDKENTIWVFDLSSIMFTRTPFC